MTATMETVSALHVAAECLAAADGDWKTAAADMGKRVRKDRKLRDALTEPLIDGAVWDTIRKCAHASRRVYWAGSATQTNQDRAADGGLDRLSDANLLNYPLSQGVKLGDAFTDQVIAEAKMHGAFARANARNERWLRLIADRMEADKPVSAVLTHSDLERLQREAEKDAA